MFSVGIWYSCANQFMVQRCLGARSEWDARMGVVMAGFSKALLPFIVVVPGIIAFYLFQDRLNDGDQAWPFMVREFLPAGFTGLVLAGLASAIMSTLSAITNSSSTIFTLDLYRQLIRKNAPDHELHLVGRISSAVIMLIGVLVALLLARTPGITVFGIIQQTFFYMAAPISACFLIGILWRGATSAGAIWAMVLGFAVYTPLVRLVVFPGISWLRPYNSFTHHTFVVLLLSAVTLVLISLFTQRRTAEALEGVIWSRKALKVRNEEGEKEHRGFQSLTLWWALMAASIIGLCLVTALYGSRTKVVQAEQCDYSLSGGIAELQSRGTLPDFNMWTGRGQLLFKPEVAGDSVTFNLSVKDSAEYSVALLITRGPGYGPFKVELNGQPFQIRSPQTIKDVGRFHVEMSEAAIYNPSEGNESYTMHRLSLGVVRAQNKQIALRIISTPVDGCDNLIGVDQIIIVRKEHNEDPVD
jgi:hypothetical protein